MSCDHFKTTFDSPIGMLTAVCDANGERILFLQMEGQRYFEGNRIGRCVTCDSLPIFRGLKEILDDYFGGKEVDFSVISVSPQGSSFRKKVWSEIAKIPYGKTVTYGDIAKSIEKCYGGKVSCQAVGGAVGHNPIAVLIPCHRVIGAGWRIVGYAGGVDRKIKLLQTEGVNISMLKA